MNQPHFRHARSGGKPAGAGRRPSLVAVITILIAAAVFFSLYVPIYARATPKVGDFPFFYFYLIVYMPVTGIVLWIVVALQKRVWPRPDPADPAPPPPGPPWPSGSSEPGSEAAR